MNCKPLQLISTLLLLAGAAIFLAGRARFTHNLVESFKTPRIPTRLSPEDIETPTARRACEWMRTAGQSIFLNSVVKPFVDDPNTLQLETRSLEVTSGQFPLIYQAAADSATILHIERPRLFVVNRRVPNKICTENSTTPLILIDASLVDRVAGAADWRFLLGRELTSIKLGYYRPRGLAVKILGNERLNDSLGGKASRIALLPFLEWLRQTAISQDRGGLICCQDEEVAEQNLLRLALGLDDEGSPHLDVDGFLAQTKDSDDLSAYSTLVLAAKQFASPQPFAPQRIRLLRAYAHSPEYTALWRR